MLFVLTGIKKIHFVGIGGSGMSGLAEVLKLMGFYITGSDIKKTEVTLRLENLGIPISYEHKEENVKGADLVVFSSAISPDNPELLYAKKLNIPVIRRAEMLSELTKMKFSICISGSHGKSTTTSMIAHILKESGFEPNVIVGGKIRGIDTGGIVSWGHFLVAEADESDMSFLHLFPTVAVITNIDNEHLDTYKSIKNLKEAFYEFMLKVPFYGGIVYFGEDDNLKDIVIDVPRKKLSYGFSENNDFYAKIIRSSLTKTEFEVYKNGKKLGKVMLSIPGKYNVLNSLASICIADMLNIPFFIVKKALRSFRGVERRFEFKDEINNVILLDDYAHHPTEIKEFLKCVRDFWKRRKIVVVFQPHRYTRTKLLYKELADSLRIADIVFVLPIYPAGEKKIKGVTHKLVLDELKGSENLLVYDGEKNLRENLQKVLKRGFILCSIGAGNVNKIVEEVYYDIVKK